MEGQDYSQAEPTTGQTYAQYVLKLWIEASDLSNEVTNDMMKIKKGDNVDSDKLFSFSSKLLTIWKQLYPKMKGRSVKGDKELSDEFMSFEKYRTDPQALMSDTSDLTKKENVFTLEGVVRRAIEELKITEWNE